jgi:hypothetical protein
MRVREDVEIDGERYFAWLLQCIKWSKHWEVLGSEVWLTWILKLLYRNWILYL